MFFVVSGAFIIVTSLPLVYLALRSYRDGRELHRVQLEVARLVSEMRELQHEIHTDQREARTDLVHTKETVERVRRRRHAGAACRGSRSRSVAERIAVAPRTSPTSRR